MLDRVGKAPELYHRKLHERYKQKQTYAEITTPTSKSLLASFRTAHRIDKCKKIT